jgi:flagellar P-ring protein precursor FlgI
MYSKNLLLSKMIQKLIKACLGVFAVLMMLTPVHAERIKDLANIQGIRENQLIGYGLVVGLEGTGDSTTQVPLTLQTTISMLQQMGITMPAGTLDKMVLKNVAAVMVTTSLPAFAQAGQTLDVTVSSMANAKSIKGGTLLMTPLKGADGQTYAIAQGNVLVAGAGASANGSSTLINQLSVGRISGGATIEKTVPNNIALQEIITLELKESDFSTASMVVKEINRAFNQDISFAQDARVINVRPNNMDGNRVGFLAALESLNVNRAKAGAKVILNARTGSIVLNQSVTLENCAVAHGNLSVVISTAPVISQPNAFSNGRTVEAKTSQISINQDPGNVIQLGSGTSLSEVVRALNAVGATPQDLQAILQAIKAAGSLRADLEII